MLHPALNARMIRVDCNRMLLLQSTGSNHGQSTTAQLIDTTACSGIAGRELFIQNACLLAFCWPPQHWLMSHIQ